MTSNPLNHEDGQSNQTEAGRKLVVKFELPFPSPSLNEMLRMNPWQRNRFKLLLQSAVWFAIRASGYHLWMMTISKAAPNGSPILSSWREYCMTIRRSLLKSKSGKSKSITGGKKALK